MTLIRNVAQQLEAGWEPGSDEASYIILDASDTKITSDSRRADLQTAVAKKYTLFRLQKSAN